jgi:hypothetical protein
VGRLVDKVSSDDQTRAVDAVCLGAVGGQRIVEGGVGAAVGIVEEAVRAAVIDVPPDDQTRAVESVRVAAART